MGVDRGVRALALLIVLAGISACEDGPADGSRGHGARAESLGRDDGADPGGYLPSVCLGRERLRLWRRYDTVSDEERARTRGTDCDWAIIVQDGDPIVVATKPQRPATVSGFVGASAVEKGAPGYLVGYDDGEYGGSLGWASLQGDRKQTLLGQKNVVAILRAHEYFVALTSRYGSEGRAYEVIPYFDHFELGRMVELPGRPTVSAVEPAGSVLIATLGGLHRLSPDFELEPLVEGYWMPESLTLDGNTVYLGMHGEVAVVKLSGKHAEVTRFLPP